MEDEDGYVALDRRGERGSAGSCPSRQGAGTGGRVLWDPPFLGERNWTGPVRAEAAQGLPRAAQGGETEARLEGGRSAGLFLMLWLCAVPAPRTVTPKAQQRGFDPKS